jgi:uncharacterized phage infection (PIP) family protein YhgE
MAEITAASAEQSDGIQQVNQAITKMDEATQQNAALVEEAAAAAGSMRDQANNLNQAVGIFKLQENATGTPHRSAAPGCIPSSCEARTGICQVPKSYQSRCNSGQFHSQKVSKQAKEDDWEEF